MLGKIIVPMITPFDENLEIDYEVISSLVNYFINEKMDAIILADDVGEGHSLDDLEKINLFKYVKEISKDKIKIIGNITKNSTDKTIRFLSKLSRLKLDAYSLSIPYVIHPNQEGIYLHFKTITSLFKNKKFILSQNKDSQLESKTIIKILQDCPNIIGVKLVKSDPSLIKKIKETSTSISVYVDDYKSIIQSLKNGVDGIFSSLGHLYPHFLVELIEDYKINIENTSLDDYISKIVSILNNYPQPISLKYVLSRKNLRSMNLRLPLTFIEKEEQEKLDFISNN